jgi:hypothetical protein
MKTFLITIFACLTATAFAASTDTPDLDLVNATINGHYIFDLSVDQVTDILGRPSGVLHPESKGEPNVVSVQYIDRGLDFHFPDPSKPCERLTVYLSRQGQSGESIGYFSPYPGTISRGLNANWKVKQLLDAFAEFNPRDHYSDASAAQIGKLRELDVQQEAINARARRLGMPEMPKSDTAASMASIVTHVVIPIETHVVDCSYEESTKFLERLDISGQSKRR